jgi:hypothetical protein
MPHNRKAHKDSQKVAVPDCHFFPVESLRDVQSQIQDCNQCLEKDQKLCVILRRSFSECEYGAPEKKLEIAESNQKADKRGFLSF